MSVRQVEREIEIGKLKKIRRGHRSVRILAVDFLEYLSNLRTFNAGMEQ